MVLLVSLWPLHPPATPQSLQEAPAFSAAKGGRKNKGHKKNNAQVRRPKISTVKAAVVRTITLEERANERLSEMISQSGDLTAAENFRLQKEHREKAFVAIETERQQIIRAIESGRLNAENLNRLEDDGFSLFHHVVISGWTDLAIRLLPLGANPDARDASGRSARDWAHALNYTSMIKALEPKPPPAKAPQNK